MIEKTEKYVIVSYKEIKEKLGITGNITAIEPAVIDYNQKSFEDEMGLKIYLKSEDETNGQSDL
jgi:hypothetical protein